MTADELKELFAALPEMEEIEPIHTWEFWRWDLRQKVRDDDPENFLKWPGVVGTMFVGNAPYIDYEVLQLPINWLLNLNDPKFGNPDTYQIGNTETSGNLIHQAYHLLQINEDIHKLDTIVEIGGGYGAMALVCHRLGFRGRYIIYDLPEFSLLQQYYLSNVGIEGIEFLTFEDLANITRCDLLIGLYSLSEMGLDLREKVLSHFWPNNYLLTYQSKWGGIDNEVWAKELMIDQDFAWDSYNIPHLPNNSYLIGERF